MYNPYPFYYPPPQQGGGNNPIETMRETVKFFDEMEERNKKKSEKPKDGPKSRLFTKLEVVMMLMAFSLPVGWAQLTMIIAIAQNSAGMLQQLIK